MKNIIVAAVLAGLQVGILAASFICKTDILFPAALSLWMYAAAYCIYDIRNNIQMLSFLGMFYLLILGGQTAVSLLRYRYNVPFHGEYEFHTNLLICLALISLFAAYLLVTKVGGKKENAKKRTNEEYYEQYKELRFVSKFAFYFTAIFWLADLAQKALFVRANGYYALYSSFKSALPYPCRILVGLAPFVFYIFLAARPKKKESLLPIAVFLLCTVASVLTGRRIQVAVSLLILIIFAFTSDARAEEPKEKWITKPLIIAAVIFIPIMIGVLQVYSRSRVGKDLNFFRDFVLGIKSFLCSQGYTVNLIKYEQYFNEILPKDRFYSLQTTTRFLRTSPLTSWFMPESSVVYGQLSAEGAMLGNKFADIISYLINPEKFLSGWGTGSCYLAELFHDFGYLGIVAGNIIYGVIFGGMKRLWNNKAVFAAIAYIMLDKLLLTPRYNFDYFLDGFTSLPRVMLILCIFLGAQVLKKIKNKGAAAQ